MGHELNPNRYVKRRDRTQHVSMQNMMYVRSVCDLSRTTISICLTKNSPDEKRKEWRQSKSCLGRHLDPSFFPSSCGLLLCSTIR